MTPTVHPVVTDAADYDDDDDDAPFHNEEEEDIYLLRPERSFLKHSHGQTDRRSLRSFCFDRRNTVVVAAAVAIAIAG